MSRIEAGKVELDARDFRVDRVINDVVTTLRALGKRKGIEVNFRIPLDVPRELRGDPLRLGQILTHLEAKASKRLLIA